MHHKATWKHLIKNFSLTNFSQIPSNLDLPKQSLGRGGVRSTPVVNHHQRNHVFFVKKKLNRHAALSDISNPLFHLLLFIHPGVTSNWWFLSLILCSRDHKKLSTPPKKMKNYKHLFLKNQRMPQRAYLGPEILATAGRRPNLNGDSRLS